MADVGVEVRTGVHVGEVERRGSDIDGIVVHLAARVMAAAQAGEILVSSVVPLLMSGSDTTFSERGEHRLKDIPAPWTLYAANI